MVDLGPPPGSVTDRWQVGSAASGGNPYTLAGTDYERYRPTYPPLAVDTVLSGLQNPTVLDVGAGSGKFTRALAARLAL